MTTAAWEEKAKEVFVEARAGKLKSDDVIIAIMELDEQYDRDKPFRNVKRLSMLAGPQLEESEGWGV